MQGKEVSEGERSLKSERKTLVAVRRKEQLIHASPIPNYNRIDSAHSPTATSHVYSGEENRFADDSIDS